MNSFRGLKDCDENNMNRQFDCINNFMFSQLKCNFPWSKIDSDKNRKYCSTTNELDEFYNLYIDILHQKISAIRYSRIYHQARAGNPHHPR